VYRGGWDDDLRVKNEFERMKMIRAKFGQSFGKGE